MSTPTQPLRDEHKELLPHIEKLREVADTVGEAAAESLRQDVGEVSEFLSHHFIPHAQAEDRALYPVVGRVMGAPAATSTMSRDHVEVVRLIDELKSLQSQLASGAVSVDQAKALRRVLYGLYALLKVHFAKEEEIYLPLLDVCLTAAEAQEMFAAMEAAAREARGQHP